LNSFEYIAQILKAEGTEWLPCFLSNPIIEEAAKQGIRPVAFRHERGAVMAADGYSRVSDRRKFGVVAVQAQAGAENAVGGLAQANADNVPILVLPGGNNLESIYVKPNFVALRSWETVVKSGQYITRADHTADVMRRAFHGLRNGRGGPVAVEMPHDVCAEPVSEGAMTYTSPVASQTRPSHTDVQDAVKALVGAKNPLIWAGAGVLSAGATEELRELAELLDIPVFTTMPGKSAIDERHALSLGAGSGMTTGVAAQWIDECDVLLAVGASLTASPYARPIPAGKFLIHNVLNVEEINKDAPSTMGLVGDARLTLLDLIEEAKGQIGEEGRSTGVREKIAAIQGEWLGRWRKYLENDDEPINPYRVIHELNQNLDLENSMVTHDAGAPRDQLVPFYRATSPHSYIGWGKTTHLGFSIPMMIGAKQAMPERFCLNVMGDAAFGMSGLDIETSSRAGIPITTVLLNNGGMATYPDSLFPTALRNFGVSLMQGDYAGLAIAMGAEGIRVSKTSELGPALKKARELNADGKTVLIDAKTGFEAARAPDKYS
jgi:acetolactate synthase-1/2/3 large subunit